MSEIFKDYEAYNVLFARNKYQQRRIYYFFCYELFVTQKYTYVYDDFSAIAAIKKPTDKDVSTLALWSNPLFALSFGIWTGYKACKKANEYIAFAENIAAKYYNPQTDCYIKNIGVQSAYRGQGKLRAMIDEICGDMPIYLETHDANNVRIYQKLGFRLCEAVEWCGTIHYAMRRD